MEQVTVRNGISEYPCIINGEGYWPKDVAPLSVKKPADGCLIGLVPDSNEEIVAKAVQSAEKAFVKWRDFSPGTRAKLLNALSIKIMERKEILSSVLSEEVGKPLKEATSEVKSSAQLIEYFAQEALRIKGEIPPQLSPCERIMITWEPVGVVGAITPFNYPLSTLACKLGAGLAAGCTVIAKPDEHTPLSTLLMAKLFIECDFPPGVFNVVTGKGQNTGALLVNHPHVRLITFTGSVETGQRILKGSAPFVRKVILELGGNCAAIVSRNSPWRENLEDIVKQCFKNSGQYCYRINRIYVEEEIFDKFVSRFVYAAGKLKIGLPKDKDTDLGPLNNEKILEKVQRHISDAISKGANICCGGERITNPVLKNGIYFPPTIIANANQDMLLMQEETFGPVVGVMPVRSIEQAVELTNQSSYGLAAYLFISDIRKALQLAEKLEVGSVWINKIHQAYFSVPFGGVKMSGLGREKSSYGIEEFQELKATYLNLG